MKKISCLLSMLLMALAMMAQVQTATLDGSKSTDVDGTIAHYQWAQVGSTPGPCIITNATSATATVVPSGGAQWKPGVYTFQLTVTDNLGATSIAITHVNVNSTPPIVDAGANQNIQLPASTATLRATATTTLGIVKSWFWSENSGPSTVIFSRRDTSLISISGLVAGTYKFTMTISDNYGVTATDTVSIIVTSANQVPKSDAGPDRTITLPVSSVAIGGLDLPTDASVAWIKLSGGTAVISSPSQSITNVTGLVAGKYIFEKRVTVNGITSMDDVTIIVKNKCCWICHLFGSC